MSGEWAVPMSVRVASADEGGYVWYVVDDDEQPLAGVGGHESTWEAAWAAVRRWVEAS